MPFTKRLFWAQIDTGFQRKVCFNLLYFVKYEKKMHFERNQKRKSQHEYCSEINLHLDGFPLHIPFPWRSFPSRIKVVNGLKRGCCVIQWENVKIHKVNKYLVKVFAKNFIFTWCLSAAAVLINYLSKKSFQGTNKEDRERRKAFFFRVEMFLSIG